MNTVAHKNLLEIGELLHDTATDRVGEFHGAMPGWWTLRTPGAGREWAVESGAVEPAGAYEYMRAETARLNARRRRMP
ncbi:hypothetical protein I5Q34_20355 [Streptomyces sp. AV19]|uniref:hypothetical protein n=1 Tax=Streptomyces sp. AV19 TaxID=2793068 RepID=UPI0018FEA93D|nr:hypothetical protein [Streptomyces sp. AV19]MBH1936600.1 hypothetical protein [Streptomyces sp. AV19]MDG4532660.1 hypothetical protein [Streptomyces sp. AV19]